MRRSRGIGVVVVAGMAALLLVGCGNQGPTDYTEIVTFTDEHGRVCTGAVVIDQEQNEADDYEITSLDCEYPPEGAKPGPDSYLPLPDRDEK